MRYTAEVRHQSVRPNDDDRYVTVPFEAKNTHAAARMVADTAALRRYGKEDEDGDWVMGDAMSTRLEVDSKQPLMFRAFIGAYDGKGCTTGTTITIRLHEAVED